MSGRVDGGRDRYRKDYTSRYDEKSQSGHSNNSNPPSRHLWVGNLSHVVVERDLSRYFSQFGELDSIAFQPSRSYAFINFKRDEDAMAAMRELQGFALGGNPIRIEFAKADKPSAPSRDEDYSQHREEKYYGARGSFSQGRHASPDQFYPEKSKMSDKNTEPSEVLWIGFPALLKVDEMILRKAFSPFGEIDKITTFPGRTYAFVRFRGVASAWRAKETLQGKLFGNPRVHICFAKNDSGSSNGGRSSMNAPLSPRSPHLFSNFDSGDFDSRGLNRKSNLWTGGNNAFEMKRSAEFSSKLGPSQDRYEHGSPTKERGPLINNFPQRFPQPSPFYEDPWDLPEDTNLYHRSKKLKTGPFPQDKELPEYPLSDLEQDRRIIPKLYPDFPPSETFDKKMKSGPPLGYKQTPDPPITMPAPYGEKSEHWREPYDNFQDPDFLPPNAVARKRFSPDSEQSSVKEWKWEGTIAKGGTPVCRARCFPVGKVLDMLLPEFLDCTARTGLDMLSKHYYEAASAWVVFFVPESDSDIVFYNEFMQYLGEKQRAAVAKLDDRTTLFLVPPSEFSEKVLKVPGKLSISGVVLRLERPGTVARPPYQNETKDTNLLPLHNETLYTKLPTPPAGFAPVSSLSDLSKSGINNTTLHRNVATSASPVLFHGSAQSVGSLSDQYIENRHEYPIQQQQNAMGPNSTSHHVQNPMLDIRNIQPQASNNSMDPIIQERHFVIPREIQETGSSNYTVGISTVTSGNALSTQQEIKPAASLATTLSSLPPDQLAQLASSLLGHQRQPGSMSNVNMAEELRQRNLVNESVVPLPRSQNGSFQNSPMNSGPQTSQMVQVPQIQNVQQHQISNATAGQLTAQRDLQTGALGNNHQQVQNSDARGEGEADPQKRLQATLQLAAALLQQIQQGKGN